MRAFGCVKRVLLAAAARHHPSVCVQLRRRGMMLLLRLRLRVLYV